MEKKYLTVKEVAVMLGIAPVTVYKWLREGLLEGTYFKIGGIYRFIEEQLNDVMFGGKKSVQKER